MESACTTPEIRLAFGQPSSACHYDGTKPVLDLAVPSLAGPQEECLACSSHPVTHEKSGNFCLLRTESGEILAGAATFPCDGAPEEVTYEAYRELLEIVDAQAFYRAWNFVPRINAERHGMENYRSFNLGRFRAFLDRFGTRQLESHLPAASAVGIEESSLSVAFLTGNAPVTYFENPRQVPAYHYPKQYGAQAPSFARGARVDHADTRTAYLSGTSSICGHATVGEENLKLQIETTLENIDLILTEMGFPNAMTPDARYGGGLRVYLRNRQDLPIVRDHLAERLSDETLARTLFVQADICRAALDLEIEGVFTAPLTSCPPPASPSPPECP